MTESVPLGIMERSVPSGSHICAFMAKLHDRGVDADQAAQAGQIEVETPANAYFRSGTFSTDDILTFWGQGISKAETAACSPSCGPRARCRRC